MKFFGAILALSVFVAPLAWGYDTRFEVTGRQLPKELQGVGVDNHLGQKLDLNLPFTDETGRTAPLGTFFKPGHPVLMAMVYYTCPGLCNYHLNGLTEAMKNLKWTTGKEFDLVAVSMNPAETPDLAAKKMASYIEAYGRPEGKPGWHFLVGAAGPVKELANELGFRYNYLADKKQFAHASVTYVITPEGKISRYLQGISVDPNTLKLSLLEASDGKIGSVFEKAVLFCFHFDPTKGKYTLFAFNLMRLGAALTVFLMALILIPVWWREHRRARPTGVA